MNCQENYATAFMGYGMVEAVCCEELSEVSTEEQEEVKELYQPLKVYLRVRPFSKAELENNENQDCLIIENQETVMLQAPKELAQIKNNEKKIGQSAHQFTFTKVFGPNTMQNEFFEGTMKDVVKAYLDGRNGLVFTYGVTNAGKSFTVQGCPKDGGILPRSLDMIFNHIKGRQYSKMNLKPCFSNLTKKLNDVQVKQEESMKAALLFSLKEETENIWKPSDSDSMSSSYNSTTLPLDQLDLKWVNVTNSEEACKILKVGNKNRSLACTKMNQQSSRSHSIFSIRLLSLSDEDMPRTLGISELSLCDLAGSERCHKAQTFGDRLKEAGNINNSLLILGKCIAALKQNQNSKLRPTYIPFRESKLTRLFQPFFCGKGKACMIVNVSQCASTYDETLHVMKFSAVAKQVIPTFQHKLFDYFPQKYSRREDKPTVHFNEISVEQFPTYADIPSSSEDEEIDITILSHEDLLKTTEMLKDKLIAERQGKLLLEVQIRKEMAKAMFQQLMETEEAWSKRLEDLKESYEEKLENKFEMYKDAIKKHAYTCAMDQVEERYVPIEEFIAEQEKVQEREMNILELKLKLGEQNSLFSENPCLDSTKWKMDLDAKCKMMEETSDALQKPCKKRDKLIKSLKLKIQKLNEMLQDAKEEYRKIVEEDSTLKQMVRLKEQEIIGLQNRTKCDYELKATLSHLREELKESKGAESIKQHKSKKGFFASLKY
ncbi:kinesin-like protein KIF20A isoform X7 [Crotalus tigris]|uniref:kinesin-like protein KIF20A isoform X7 n=1 Tax=Crotalus tigris TaxID=88082 RepID=UPI00192F4D9D|nr:kinesin-like protein KIF20A isoform X7 [Crotalus tigris]